MKNRLMVQKFQKDHDAIDAEAGRQMRTTESSARLSPKQQQQRQRNAGVTVWLTIRSPLFTSPPRHFSIFELDLWIRST
jgi:hypothetical protein